MPKHEKMFTLPLQRFVYYYLSTIDKRQLEYEDALVIAAIDKDEVFCHVQFIDLDTNKKLDKPLLWNIADWKSDYQVFKSKKKQSAIQRIKWDIAKQNLELVANRFLEINFFAISKEAAIKMAETVIKKNDPQTFVNLGIKLAVFTDDMIPKDLGY